MNLYQEMMKHAGERLSGGLRWEEQGLWGWERAGQAPRSAHCPTSPPLPLYWLAFTRLQSCFLSMGLFHCPQNLMPTLPGQDAPLPPPQQPYISGQQPVYQQVSLSWDHCGS